MNDPEKFRPPPEGLTKKGKEISLVTFLIVSCPVN
jgi:hypothetical protein